MTELQSDFQDADIATVRDYEVMLLRRPRLELGDEYWYPLCLGIALGSGGKLPANRWDGRVRRNKARASEMMQHIA